MIKIYDINDKLLMQAEVTSAAKREQEMSKSDYITLSFSAAEKVILPVGAYINYTYKIDKVREVTRKFLLLESYEPIQTDECSWKYTPQFQHPKMILSKTPFFIYTRNSQNVEVKQNVWSFVGTTSALSRKIADFLNKDLMFGECGWKVIFSNVTANTVNVSFSDNDFISALTAITNAIGDNCEWHIDYDDEIIYIGKVLVGATPVVLEVGKNVGVPNISNSKESYYNAFSIFGGTRNITQVNSKGENVSSGDIRLQLDEGNGTILIDGKERSYSIDKYSTLDLRVDKINEPLFTKVLNFSQIFPSLNTYVYNVRGRVKYVLDENNKKIPISYNADGSVKEYKTFTVWYMRLAYPTTEKVEGKTIINTTVDDGVTHYWYDFQITDNLRINGKNIGCSFEANFNTGALSTPLAGRGSNGEYVGFELTYHKEASSSHTSDDVSKDNFSVLAGDYEIIYQEDNEVIIPTNEADMLIPRGESMPSLKCNITVLYNIAMSDSIYYEDAQNRLLEKAKEGIVRLLSDLNNYEIKSYSDVFLEENPELQIGQSVTYKDGHGYELATRVLKLSTNIDFGFIQTITLGNQVIKGTITQLKEDVQTIIASGGSSGNGGGYSVSQLRNIIAKYGSDNFLSKQFDDTAKGTIIWEKVQKLLSGLLVGNFNSENGGSWTPDAEGRSHLITDYLEVRMKAIFEELVIKKTSTIGGKEIISPAGGVVAHKVEEVTVTYNNVSQKAYRCYFLAEQEGDAVDNDFAIGDQVRSESFNVRKGTYHKVGNHFYWRLIIGRDEDPVELEGKKYHYIDLSDTDCATASDVPAKGDVLNQCGNRTDVERQNCLIFSAVDTYSPSVSLYHGINSYSFASREYVEYGVNKQTNKAFFNVYGDMYVGDRPTKENGYEGSSYIKYDSATKQVSVKGKISAKSTVDGKELSQYIKENSAKGLTEEQVNNLIKNSQVIADLQNQVDGAIETWFYEGVPTLTNAPASSWTSDKDKDTHLGDLYYDNKTGKAYRFAKDGNTYKWTIIADTDIAKALSDASKAQETANGKMKVFSTQPNPPYQVGDIWVNATYPADGSTYKNEVLRCQTNKAAGSQFVIGDWIKASKYTDDTVANAAKKAAEEAQKAAQTAQTNITNLDKTVTTNKKAFDNYVTDGYLEPSEIAAMAQDSKRLEDDFAAAQKSYNEVKDAEVLKNTKELTDLKTAFTTLTTAKTELVTYLSDISKRYNETDTNGKAAIVSAVGTKFTNFQSAYSAFYDKLGLANAYITSKIYGDLKQNITDLAGYKYLKDALGQTTDIDGGLVMTTLLALRDADGNVQSGINGAIDPNRGKKSIATWWGGRMVDKDYNSGSLTPATSLIRFDGSGYLANGAIWWDVDGKVHADPTSFIISEKNLGAYLTFFEPTWKSGSAGTSVADLVSLKPNAPFSKLGVSGDATFEGAITFHGISITYDTTNKAIKIDGNLYATGGITAYGAGTSTSTGGGLNGSVKSYADAIRLTTENLSEIASAYSVAKLYSEIQNLASAVPSISVSVPTGGNALTGATYDASTGTITFTKGTFLTAHQSLDSYVNEIAVSGTGNAITAVSKSGKKVTFTKGATYLTAHQSLAAYATQNWVKNEATAHNADMVDNYHASGLFTGFSISDVANKVTISIGGNSKALNLVRAFPSGVGNNFNDIATHGNSMGMSNIAAPYASSTANYQTLNGYVNPNGQTGWHHYINLSYTDSNNTATSPNMWQTQFAIKAGTTEVYVRSRAGGKISNDAAWAAPWVRLARVTDNVASASKVANALSWSGYSSGSYNGSAVKSISIPNNTNQLTNGAGFITSSASITGNAGSATKLQNARTINGTSFNGTANIVTSYWGTTRKLWGNSVNGNADVNGSITIANTDGVYVQIGDVRLVYDKANTAIKVVKSDGTTAANFYATGGITAYGEGSGSSGGGGLNGSVKSYADALKLASESLSEIASAYSIKALDSRISSLEGGSATSIETTGSGNAVTSVSKSETKITFTKGSTFSLNGHTHDFITVGANQTITATQYTKSRLSVRPYNNSGGPTTYGNILEVVSGNSGGGQLGMEWSGSQTKTDGTDTNVGKLYYRSKRDNMAGWTVWKRLAFAEELAWGNISGKPTSLSGYGITDGVNAVSVTGSGNAVTAASVSGHTLTLTKGSSFSLSNHTHYIGTTQVHGSSAEQALTGITKIDNILKLSKATVTVNTSYKAEQNRLVIYGNTYGDDANYIKSARKLSYGDGGPQLVFSTSENPDASGVQSAALVYTDHDTIGAGVSLSFVTNQGDAYFIAPHIKALTAFQGNLAWSYITNKPTTLSGFGITDGLRSVTHPSESNVFVTGISTSGTAITYTKSYTKKSLSTVGTSGWTHASIDGNIIPDMSFIAYWNGAYSGKSSNLAYCNKGAFGSFAIKNSLAFSELTSKPTTISGYGITDAYTKSQVDAIAAKYLPLTGGTLTGQLKIVASALDGAYNGLRIGNDCYIGDCNFGNTIGLMGVDNNNAGMVKFGKGGMKFGYNGSNHIASTTAQWTNFNADLLDGWHKDNIVWSGAVNSNTASLSHYWVKLFDITVTGNQYDDRSFTFLFSNGYSDTYSVVVLRIRQNGAKNSGAYNFSISLRELVGNMSSRLRVYYNNATGNVQLWGNCHGQYGSLSYTIIKKTGRTSADFTSQGTLVTNTSFSAAQSLPATTGDSPYTLLDGATRIGIVKQADQLVTARSLWGQSFNGTANVNGTLTNTNSAGTETIIRCSNTNGQIDLLTSANRGVYDRTKTRWLIATNGVNSWLDCGNVGIGTNAPAYKLDVSGDARATNFRGALVGNAATATKLHTARTIWGQSFNGTANVNGSITGVDNITMSNNSYLYGKNTGGTAIQLIAMASWNSVDIGRGALTYGYTTQVMGKTVVLTASDDSGKNVKSVELSTAKLYSNVTIETEGGLLAHGGVTAYSSSDIRLKQDLRKLDYLGIIKAMGGTFGFAWKKDNTRSIGWIAQHVLCNPHLKDIVETDENGYFKINYWSPKLIATAFGAIEQVGDEVSRLKARVVFLESEVQRLSGKQDGNNKKRLDNKNINLLN